MHKSHLPDPSNCPILTKTNSIYTKSEYLMFLKFHAGPSSDSVQTAQTVQTPVSCVNTAVRDRSV